MAKNEKNPQPETKIPEHIEAEKVEDYHITAAGKIEQTPEEKKRMYREGLIRTIVAALSGIVGGVVCYYAFGSAENRFWLLILLPLIIFVYYIQRRIIFPAFKIDMKLLNWKDWFGILFLVLIFCLVTWTILLNVL